MVRTVSGLWGLGFDCFSWSPGWPWFYTLAKISFELLVILPPTPKCWDYTPVPAYPVWSSYRCFNGVKRSPPDSCHHIRFPVPSMDSIHRSFLSLAPDTTILGATLPSMGWKAAGGSLAKIAVCCTSPPLGPVEAIHSTLCRFDLRRII